MTLSSQGLEPRRVVIGRETRPRELDTGTECGPFSFIDTRIDLCRFEPTVSDDGLRTGVDFPPVTPIHSPDQV